MRYGWGLAFLKMLKKRKVTVRLGYYIVSKPKIRDGRDFGLFKMLK